ncbi:unnamed protein product [Allacma fusca]|uniref:Uncharacterized protein n=1 Tax=Allacma fusca TaxID=39272 RepID=A0A8J2JWK2_9HEXA|nr:unnamed protein product [Allacma fusca]
MDGFVWFAVIISVLVVNFGMGIILLRGSYNKNPCQLKAWLIYQSTLMILVVLACAFIYINFPSDMKRLKQILHTLLLIPATLGFMKIVNDHKEEIEASTNKHELLVEA